MKIIEIITAAVLIVLATLLLNPFSFFMPSMILMTAIGFLIAATALFGGVVWKEYSGDEREVLHRMLAGRIAFIAGTTILVLGIAVQSVTHSVDKWLVIALVAMILVKIAGRIHADKTL